jgi:hypothetical protein
MDQATAERWVTISALVVLGVYAYRRVRQPAQPGSLKNVFGAGAPVPLGQFVTAWGVTYLVIAIMASASPGLGGSFAVLVMTADLLNNMSGLTAAIKAGETQQPQAASASQVNIATGVGGQTAPSSQLSTAGSEGFVTGTLGNPPNITGPVYVPPSSLIAGTAPLPSTGAYGGGFRP